ncbi:hypothetical protein CD790_22955 [Streptomyces sp. SAJ15]|nr:hypothetical protein CD790_22955 [Streptomyces sp. SAJ15]
MRLAALAALGVVLLSGCLGDDTGGGAPETSSAPEPRTPHDVGGDGMPRFRIALPAGFRIEDGFSPPAAPGTPAACRKAPWRAMDGDTPHLSWFSVPTDCEIDAQANLSPANGQHPRYRTVADIPPAVDRTARTVRTPLGPARVFTQRYTRCTQTCDHFDEPLAVITLDQPADPRHPALVFTSEHGEVSERDLVHLITRDVTPR